MAITPSDLLMYARKLRDDPSEPAQRSAASRAYYAAFHPCRDLAKTLPRPKSAGRGAHQQVIATLANFEGEPGARRDRVRRLGELLQHAKDLRTRADYYLDRDFSSAEAQMTLSYAERITRLAIQVTSTP